MRRLVLMLALIVGGLVALSDPTWAFRKSQAEVDSLLHARDRFVDFGVVLRTVKQSSTGTIPLATDPEIKLEVVGEHRRGAIWDRLARRWCGPSRHPVEWLCSEDQSALILHPDSMPQNVWFQGSMGSGKTTAGGMWLALRVIEHAEHHVNGGGVTAPTGDRMEVLLKMLFGPKGSDGKRRGGQWPTPWYTWREGDQVATMATGLQIDFRSGHIASAAMGSPIQGYNWGFALNDELQDYYELDGDIQMRGRAAWKGRYQRFVTVTPKDNSEYRTFRDKKATSGLWHVKRVLGTSSPFVPPQYWIDQRGELSPREYARKVLAQDVGPERMLYPTWTRQDDLGRLGNLRPLPLGAEDVTAQVLRPWGGNLQMLVGHDPGRRWHVSTLLKAYRIPQLCKTGHVWFIVGEVTSEQTTIEQHVEDLLLELRGHHHLNALDWQGKPVEESGQALVRLDPYSNSASGEKRPAKTVPAAFRAKGLMALSGAYQVSTGGKVLSGTIPKEARINMMCRLLRAESGVRRLFVACDDRGTPLAPRTVESFERSERDEAYEAEEEKGPSDLSHWTAATGYALWMLEKPRDNGTAVRRSA